MTDLVAVDRLNFRYRVGRVRAKQDSDNTIKGVSLLIERASSVGIVGESGSGKSTLLRILVGMLPVGSGSVRFAGRPVAEWLKNSPSEFRSRNQLVFQDPASSFDPRMRLSRSLAEPVLAIERRKPAYEELERWLTEVGLGSEVLPRHPHQLSGGQLQRVALARALSVRPDVVYLDEPTSSVDVSLQAQVLNLLIDLRAKFDLTLVIVSHDLAVVARMCEHLVVMKDGAFVEAGPTVDILRHPTSPYSEQLIDAARSVSLVTP